MQLSPQAIPLRQTLQHATFVISADLDVVTYRQKTSVESGLVSASPATHGKDKQAQIANTRMLDALYFMDPSPDRRDPSVCS